MMSLDSRFADRYGPLGASDFVIRLPSTIKNIMRIALASVELPDVEPVFSAKNGNLSFRLQVGAGPEVVCAIPAGTYTEATLVTALGAALGADFTVTVVDGRLTITSVSASVFTLRLGSTVSDIADRPKDWGIGYPLGFRTQEVTGQTVVAPCPMTLEPAAYYLLQLMIPDQVTSFVHVLAGTGSIPVFAKVILREPRPFDDGANLVRKEFTFLTPVNLYAVRVRLLDAYGRPVDLCCRDWSLTLELYEITSQHTRAAILEKVPGF